MKFRAYCYRSGVRLEYIRWDPLYPSEELAFLYVPGFLQPAQAGEVLAERIAMGQLGGKPLLAISVSLRGRGRSATPEQGWSFDHHIRDLEAVVQDVGVTNWILCAQSTGVAYILGFSGKHPHKVKGLILGDYPPKYPIISESWVREVEEKPWEFSDWKEALSWAQKHLRMSEEEMGRLRDILFIEDEDGKVHCSYAREAPRKLQVESVETDLSWVGDRVQCPALVFRATSGGLLTDEGATRYVRHFRATVIEVPCGHGDVLTHPTALSHIDKFLKKLINF